MVDKIEYKQKLLQYVEMFQSLWGGRIKMLFDVKIGQGVVQLLIIH